MTLRNTSFSQGRNPIQSLRSKTAYGGVLSCVDCPLVTIREDQFANLSAKVGGAVAVMRKTTEELRLIVNRSRFIDCKAAQAGSYSCRTSLPR